MNTNTIRLHRVLRAKPATVYRAFSDGDAMVKWLPPHGFTGRVHQQEVRVGGTYQMSFTNLSSGQAHGWSGSYLELVPGERLRYTATFDDPNLPGTMTTTVELKAVTCGTDLSVTQEGIPGFIPVENCYLGWRQSLELLALLVEADIP